MRRSWMGTLVMVLGACGSTPAPPAPRAPAVSAHEVWSDPSWHVRRERWPRLPRLGPIAIGPGRIRFVTDRLPDLLMAEHPEWSEADNFLVDVGTRRTLLSRPIACPGEGGVAAIAAGPGVPSMLCVHEPSDGPIDAWVVELDAEGAPRASSSPHVTLIRPEDAVASRYWETLRLASGSPPFVLYQVWEQDEPVDDLVAWNAQALVPNARPFEVAGPEEWLAATFVREGTVYVVVGIGGSQEDGTFRYEVRALRPGGPRPSQPLDLMATAPRICEGPLTTRMRTPGALTLVLPLGFEFGPLESSLDDRRIDLAGAFPVPGPQVWDAHVCLGDRVGPSPEGLPPLRTIPDALFVVEASDEHGPVLDDHVDRNRVAVAHDDGGFVAVYVRGSDEISDELRVARSSLGP